MCVCTQILCVLLVRIEELTKFCVAVSVLSCASLKKSLSIALCIVGAGDTTIDVVHQANVLADNLAVFITIAVVRMTLPIMEQPGIHNYGSPP